MDAFKTVIRGNCIALTVGVRLTLLTEVQTAELELREAERERLGHPERQQTLLEHREQVAMSIEKLRCYDYKEYMIRTHADRDKAGALLAWLVNS